MAIKQCRKHLKKYKIIYISPQLLLGRKIILNIKTAPANNRQAISNCAGQSRKPDSYRILVENDNGFNFIVYYLKK